MRKKLEPQIEHVIIYLDCCPDQNINRFIKETYLLVFQCSKKLKIIDYKFLINGHTEQSLVENKKKKCCGKIEHPDY